MAAVSLLATKQKSRNALTRGSAPAGERAVFRPLRAPRASGTRSSPWRFVARSPRQGSVTTNREPLPTALVTAMDPAAPQAATAVAGHARRPRRGAFPATAMALTAGPIARSRTGEHDPPFPGQCPPEIRAFPNATAMASPPVYELPEPKHSSWRVWTPVTLTSTVFGLRTLTITVRRVRPSPTSSTPAWNWEGDLAASPRVAWNRRALCFSLYAGKAVGSPTLQ
jgi:hypothetical protein